MHSIQSSPPVWTQPSRQRRPTTSSSTHVGAHFAQCLVVLRAVTAYFQRLVELAYELECFNTTKINALSELALAEKDHATYEMLLYYNKEQAHAEDECDTWMSKAKAYGGRRGLFWHLNKEMGEAAHIGDSPPSLNFGSFYA